MFKSVKYIFLATAIISTVACSQVTQPTGGSTNAPASPNVPGLVTTTPAPGLFLSATPTTPTTTINATFDANIKETDCTMESSSKSNVGNMLTINFVNKTNKDLKLYYLNELATREMPSKPIPAGQTFVRNNTANNHYWMIADENDNCLKIFSGIAPGESTVTLN